jgi:hypothetical protein
MPHNLLSLAHQLARPIRSEASSTPPPPATHAAAAVLRPPAYLAATEVSSSPFSEG